jgi:hypothetical protein
MKIEPLKVYKVIKGNTEGGITEGDIIWQSENGNLNVLKMLN